MKENTEISERISRMIELLESNPNSFAKILGYPRAQTVYDIVNGKSAPSYDFFRRFQISEYSDIINIDWLLTGRGEMLKTPNLEDKNTHLNTHPNTHLSHKNKEEGQCNIDLGICETPTELANKFLNNESEISVPFYDLPVSAGSLGILDMNSANITIPAGHIKLPVFRGCEAIFPIIGISMEPLVHSGDWIGIKSIDNLSRSWDFIQTGVIYLIITREDRMIKFIEKSDDDDFIVCSSPNYHSFKVYKGDILNIYRIKAVARGL